MPTQSDEEIQVAVVALGEVLGVVDACEAVAILAAGDDLQRKVFDGLQHRVGGACGCGADGLAHSDEVCVFQ